MKLRDVRISAVPDDAPAYLPVGSEDYWFKKRLQTANLLVHHGIFGRVAGPVQGELVVQASEESARAALSAAEEMAKPAPKGGAARAKVAGRARRVFIVHGRDETNLLRLQRILEKDFNLETIVMKQEAAKGRALIEKFEEEAAPANYAFVLMSPDDQVQGGAGSYAQARPNVTFELGWFVGRLSRRRVALLVRAGTRMHSDFDGIERIDFVETVEEVVGKIKKELEALG
jgi:predicted nucleotide-binding protein